MRYWALHDEGHAARQVVDGMGVTVDVEFSEVLTVVGRHDDDPPLGDAFLLEEVDHVPDVVVHVSNADIVPVDLAAEVLAVGDFILPHKYIQHIRFGYRVISRIHQVCSLYRRFSERTFGTVGGVRTEAARSRGSP